MVRARRRGAGGADLPHARAGPLLRRARLRRHPLPAAGAARRCWSSPAARARARRCSSCWRWRACCARRRGSSPGSTGSTCCGLAAVAARRTGERRALRGGRARLARRACCALRWHRAVARRWSGCSATCSITGRPAVVADEHPPHRRNAGPRDGDRERARVHPAAHRRDPAPAGARSAPRSAGCCRCCGCAGGRCRWRPRGVLAVLVFAAFASAGLPINTRYAFLAAAILCLFCGAGVFGWSALARRRPRAGAGGWRAGALVALALLAYAPSQYRSAHRELDETGAPEQRSKKTCWRSSQTTRSTCAAGRSGSPTTPRSRCSRCI